MQCYSLGVAGDNWRYRSKVVRFLYCCEVISVSVVAGVLNTTLSANGHNCKAFDLL